MRNLLALCLVASAGTASAQDADWAYKATLYGWFPGLSSDLSTPYGTVSPSVSASDVVANLDMAFMGTFSAQHGKWGFAGDLMYSDISASQASPFDRLFGEATYKQKLTALSGYALYRVSEDTSAAKFDVGAGFRAFDLSADLTFSPGRRITLEERDASKSWIVPLLAARFTAPINEKWFVEGFADLGGTGSDDQTWQVYGGLGYKIDENWSTQAGYRYMNFNQSIGKNGLGDLSVDMDGVVFAVTYAF